jgi:glyoxylase-like metal-dependent hydrolase (beta-lactamase superfamily II)
VDGQPCTLTKYRASTNCQTFSQRIQYACTRPNEYPIVDFGGGGRAAGMIAGLNQIIALSDPSKVRGRTYIIPGHGRRCDREDVIKYRDMSVILRGRVQSLINKGMTLKQVQDFRPTLDYEPFTAQQPDWEQPTALSKTCTIHLL